MPPPPQLLMLVLLRRDWRYRTRIGVIIRRRGNEMALPKSSLLLRLKMYHQIGSPKCKKELWSGMKVHVLIPSSYRVVSRRQIA